MKALPITGGTPGVSAAGNPRQPVKRETREAVRRLSQQFEAVFVNQLFQAMRASVPQGGLVGHTPGEEMFTSLMDERLATEAAQRMQRGIGESLYRQLASRLTAEPEVKP